MSIELSNIKITPNPYGAESKCKAFCSFTLNETIRMNTVKIVEGENGRFLSYPSQKAKDGNYYSIVLPITAEIKREIEKQILAEYTKSLQPEA